VAHCRKVAGDRVISTVDLQARHVHKTVHHRQDGYKGHVAVEPDTGLFTQGRLTQAAGEDNHEAVIGLELLKGEDGELEVLGDGAYGTGEARAALADQGHTAVIKPGPLRPAIADGFTLDDFTVDDQANTVTCPTASPAGSPRVVPSRSEPPAEVVRYASDAPPTRPVEP
jgi:Transposase DDE domain